MKRWAPYVVAVIATCGAAAAQFPSDDAAIVHVLSRTGFGLRPGDVEKVRSIGIQRYLDQQLHPERLPDPGMSARLAGLTTIDLNSRQIAEQFEIPQLQARQQKKADAKNPDADPKPTPEEMQHANTVMLEL